MLSLEQIELVKAAMELFFRLVRPLVVFHDDLLIGPFVGELDVAGERVNVGKGVDDVGGGGDGNFPGEVFSGVDGPAGLIRKRGRYVRADNITSRLEAKAEGLSGQHQYDSGSEARG